MVDHETISEPFQTEGLNPLTCSENAFFKASSEVMQHFKSAEGCEKIFFYGAGCGTMQAQVESMLSICFPSAYIFVEGDLLGACRACCGTQPGIVGILGTGSNACYYDGKTIAHQLPSLGYILGDEGSGNHIGKMLLKSYLSLQMPEELRTLFHNDYPYTYQQFISYIYRQPNANRFLATMAPFASAHRSHPFIQELLQHSFSQYFINQIKPLGSYAQSVALCGSVASAFADEIKLIAKDLGLSISTTLKEPLKQLALFHTHVPQ